jgi:hypothetical protein
MQNFRIISVVKSTSILFLLMRTNTDDFYSIVIRLRNRCTRFEKITDYFKYIQIFTYPFNFIILQFLSYGSYVH